MMSTPARETSPAAPSLDLDELGASGTRIAWSWGIALVIAFFVVLVLGATTNVGHATPRGPQATEEARTQ